MGLSGTRGCPCYEQIQLRVGAPVG